MKYRRGILALRRFEPPHEGLIFRDQAGSARHHFSLGRTDALQAGARRIHFSEPERVRTTEALLGRTDSFSTLGWTTAWVYSSGSLPLKVAS